MKNETTTIVHPFDPIYNPHSKVLILGSLPSVASRENAFYYGHPQNRFWQMLSAITKQPIPQTKEEKQNLLLSHGIALWDVIKQCEIIGSSDASIKNAVVNDISSLIQKTTIQIIITNGNKASALYQRFCEKQIGIKAINLPSTSPANASFNLDRLIESWKILRGFISEK